MKLSLPDVTLFCLDCVQVERSIAVIEHCKKLVDWGSVRFLTHLETDYPHYHIEPVLGQWITKGEARFIDQNDGLLKYSKWMLEELHKWIDTSHVLIVQHDGWVLNPESWDPSWLQYDYMGPLFIQYPKVGSGGFSLRSKRLMQAIAEMMPDWLERRKGQPWGGYTYEDGVCALHMRPQLEGRGMRYPSPEVAAQFAYGGNASHYCAKPFGFHGFYALDTLLGGEGKPIPRGPDFAERLHWEVKQAQ